MKIGFVVNPTAGAGGKIGLKGSDNFEEVRKRNGTPVSPYVAKKFGKMLDDGEIITCSSSMGGDYIDGKIVYDAGRKTTFMDTRRACRKFLSYGVDAVVFVGGDGTARDVFASTGRKVAILGVPAGVKMYSGVFAINVERAVYIMKEFMEGRTEIIDAEILDVDEEAFRKDELKIKLYGVAKTPAIKNFIQGGKMIYHGDDWAKKEIARFISLICKNKTCTFGPGSTVKAIADEMGVDKTLLGVDIVKDGKLIVRDASEEKILKIADRKTKIIVSPIGGNYFVFGRGNQQISAEVIRKVGVENIIVVSTPSKIAGAKFLHVDTGDENVNKMMGEWINVIVGYGIAVRKRLLF